MKRPVTVTLSGFALIILARVARLTHFEHRRSIIDFDVFHIVAKLALGGRLADAYQYARLRPLEQALATSGAFLPWTYPPQFDLVLAPFGLLPNWLAYAVFTASSLAAYLVILHRLAGRQFNLALLTVFPGIYMAATWGQNGLLTGALVGLSCLCLRRARPISAGLPLGLMVIKPHLAAGLALYSIATRRWRTVSAAAAVAAVSAILATFVFGQAIWPVFLQSVREAGQALKGGDYPLFRMTSLYAAVRTLGPSPQIAFAAQGIAAAGAMAMVLLAIRRRMPPEGVIGIAVLASLLVSPYVYDYDLPIAGMAIAILAPQLTRHASKLEQALLAGLGCIASGWGFVQGFLVGLRYGPAPLPKGVTPLTLAGLAYLMLFVLVWRVLQRERVAAGALHPAPAAPSALSGAGALDVRSA